MTILTLIGAWLRLHNLGDESLWGDEGATWVQVKDGFLDVIVRTALDTYPPLYNFIAFVFIKLFGPSEWALRLPAAILGIAAIPVIYWLGRLVAGRVAGLTAAVFLTLSPFQVFYATEARAYSLLALSSTLYLGTVLNVLTRPDRRLAGAMAVATGCALLYSHPYGTFVWASVGAAAAVCVGSGRAAPTLAMRRYLKLQAITFLLFLPWAVILLNVARLLNANGFWIPRPTLASVAGTLVSMADGPLGLALLAIGWGLFALHRWRLAAEPAEAAAPVSRSAPVLLLAAALLPLLIGIGVSLVASPIFIERYTICVLPAWYVLAAAGYASVATRPWLRGAVIGVCGIATALGFGLSPRAGHAQDWRSAGAYLAANFADSDCLLVPKGQTTNALQYYFPLGRRCVVYGPDLLAGKPNRLAEAENLFLVGTPKGAKALLGALPGAPWRADPTQRFRGVSLTRLSRPGSTAASP